MDESEKKDLIVELSLILMEEPIELVVELINQVNGNNDIVFIPDTIH
jgi:hypothetical protein